MTIIATCGHRATTVKSLTTKEYSRAGKRVLKYASYCEACAVDQIKSGNVLMSREDEDKWLNYRSYHAEYELTSA